MIVERFFETIAEIAGQRARYGGEEIDWTAVPLFELDEADIAELLEREEQAKEYAAAIAVYRIRIKTLVAGKIGVGGAVRLGPTLYRYGKPTPYRKLRDEFWTMIASSFDTVDEAVGWIRKVVSPASPKLGGLDALAVRLDVSKTGLRETVLDESGSVDPTLTSQPIDAPKTPKYAARMTDGEIRYGTFPSEPSDTIIEDETGDTGRLGGSET